MGVAGLWEVLRPAGQVRSLTELAVEDGFNANLAHQRGFRIGIDASIWFFHAAYGKEGENPELRTLFFRCSRLLQSPFLPLFVFDGPNRPAIKRGKRVGGNAHWLTQGMKNIIDAFGFEWRVAPGEAEAELAYLNRIGIIDAVLSDDVDNFLFGATTVIRNPSNTLSGNRAHPVTNAQGKDDGNHVVIYTADAILSNPSVALSRSGTILIGLLSGGDYIPAGLPGCGQKFAAGLARAGFGDSLVKAVKELKGSRLDSFLDQWRQEIRNELRTNKTGLLPSKKPSLAGSLPDDFPSLPALMSYTDPLTSENTPQKGNRKAPPVMWRNDPDPMRIASLCELYFEWGVKDIIVHRFRTVLWPGIVCRAVRRLVVDEDMCQRLPLVGARHPGSEGEDNDTAGSSSPTKRLSSTFSTLVISPPSRKRSTSGSSGSDPSAFTLSSLVPLTSPESPSSSRSAPPSSPASHTSDPSPLLLEVLSQRTHASTDSMLEYRVLIDPITLVERAESGIKGLRPPLVGGLFGVGPENENEGEGESASDAASIERLETAANAASKSAKKKRKARREPPTKPLRLWLPACMIRAAAPALAEAYDEKMRVRSEKKAKRGTKGRRGRRAETGINSTSRRTKARSDMDDEGDESVPEPSTPKKATGSRAKSKVARIGGGRGRRKPTRASEAQDDAYELIDLSADESLYSSDGGGVKENIKGKGKATAKTGPTDHTKPTNKASGKTDATNRMATTANTVDEYFSMTKPSAIRTTKSQPSTSQPPRPKASVLHPVALRRVYEEDSADAAAAAPLPKSSRPLDLLRAKSKPGTDPANSTSKSRSKPTAIPRYEEEELSSSSPPTRSLGSGPQSSLPCKPSQLALQARKKPLFVDVSDTESDIEVSDVRRPSPGTTAFIATHKTEGKTSVGDDGVDNNIGVGETSTSMSEKNTGKAMGVVIDLTAKRYALSSKSVPSAPIPTASLSPVHPGSAPLGTGTIGPSPIVWSPSKLAPTLLRRSAVAIESETEEGSEGDELPMFHYGSTQSRTKKRATVVLPAPRPFPMKLESESPVSSCASRFREKGGSRHEGENDVVEIVDVFTTPCGLSPPRSPTLSPSPIKSLIIHASVGPCTVGRSRQSHRFHASHAKSDFQTDAEPHKKTKQRRQASSESDTPISGNERNGELKSPRKSVAHSSPRHVPRAHGRPSSPTPLVLSNSGSMQAGNTIGRKSRPSDTSAIYISSGSEDEDHAILGVDRAEAEVNEDQDECTDRDADTLADTGMILSATPSPRSHGVVPALEATLPNPGRGSKFKPAAPGSKVDVRTQASDTTASASLNGTASDEGTVVPRQLRRAPLLVARAKQRKGRDNDVIDLTSD